MLILRCDRCQNEHLRPLISEQDYSNKVTMPSGWTETAGKHLCKHCADELIDFLLPIKRRK